jgi:hypothetical protein
MQSLTLVAFAALAVSAPMIAQEVTPPETLAATEYTAMSTHERWHGYLHENLLSNKFALQVLGTAFIEHISKDPKEWGVGARGYFHRVQDRFLAASINGGVHSSLAAALHEDTRYWRYNGKGHGFQRAGHAIERTFLTYNDAGHRVFDISGMAGIYAGTIASTYWNPRPFDRFERGVRAGDFGIVSQAGANLFKEFGPDLKHLIKRK